MTSLVSGRVMQVRTELGQRVTAGEALATVYSPELADAQTAFIVARADQVAHAQRQTRTQRLTAIGAASREELETLEAERAMHDSAVEKARARLILLGIPEERTQRLAGPQDVVTTIDVRAPLAGVVTQRTANPGLNIDPATPLFTIVDLSTVWVMGDLFERDFAKVREGSPVTITSAAYPGAHAPRARRLHRFRRCSRKHAPPSSGWRSPIRPAGFASACTWTSTSARRCARACSSRKPPSRSWARSRSSTSPARTIPDGSSSGESKWAIRPATAFSCSPVSSRAISSSPKAYSSCGPSRSGSPGQRARIIRAAEPGLRTSGGPGADPPVITAPRTRTRRAWGR